MPSEDQQPAEETAPETARTVGQLVKYSREVNGAETVDEVATYALEATYHVMDGHPSPTVVEVRAGELRVIASMSPGEEVGGQPGPLARQAYERGETLISPGRATVGYRTDRTAVVDGGETTTIAVPSVRADETGDAGVVLVVRWPDAGLDRVAEHHLKPLQYLGDHVATAVTNIRARERLERTRTDLKKRKETLEVYDRLLRHDLGNDLQVITSFANELVDRLEGPAERYAHNISETASNASDLIERVGGVLRTLEQEEERTARDLAPIVESAVGEVDRKFTSLTVDLDRDSVGGQVYAGDLLESIFTNILSNAAVHNDRPVGVNVWATEPSRETVVVVFADDGVGVPEALRDDIFEMGQKGPDSEGTGFGLGLARTLTESYGGTVAVGDSEAGGAEFRVTLQRP